MNRLGVLIPLFVLALPGSASAQLTPKPCPMTLYLAPDGQLYEARLVSRPRLGSTLEQVHPLTCYRVSVSVY